MFARCVRLAVFFLTFAVLATIGGAAEIRMTDGHVYYGVTIARRDPVSLECFGPRGRMLLPIYQIAQIDGVRMIDIPEGTFPYVASFGESTRTLATPPPTAPVRRNVPVATATPPPRPILRTPPPVSAAAPTIIPRTPAPVRATAAPTASPTPADTTPWAKKTPWLSLTVLAVVVLWALSILRLRRDIRRAPVANARFWMIAAIVLPVVGYLLYELSRIVKQWWRSRRMIIQHRREFIFLDADHRPILIPPGEQSSGLENAKDVLQDALLDRASDVHIEPGATECRVRFRVDGVMHPRMKFPVEEGLRLVSALKTVAQLDIAERRKAQDGRFGGRVGEQQVDFRAATTPSVYGEKLVLRVLDQKSGLRGLTDLGMDEKMMARFAEIIQSRSGMILATGPTGSGKTSSLYAALTRLDKERSERRHHRRPRGI